MKIKAKQYQVELVLVYLSDPAPASGPGQADFTRTNGLAGTWRAPCRNLSNLITDQPTTLGQYLMDEAYRFEPERPFDMRVIDLAA